MDLPSLSDQKADLRQRCYDRRTQIARAEAESAAKAVAERVARTFDGNDAVAAAYWPLPSELDPRPALRMLMKQGASAALPRMIGDGQPLHFHAWHPEDPLIAGRFKVMEPAATAPRVTPSIVLVPLLAFDRACNRLGHGKGYYDRTLQGLREQNPALRAVGVAFAAQEAEAVPTDHYDQTLDMVITERAMHEAP